MTFHYIHAEVTHTGLVREHNEDALGHAETPNGHLFVLCDGMGGAAGGEVASKIALESIIEFFNRTTYQNLQVALYRAMEFANEQIYATAKAQPSLEGMGTTCNLLLVSGDRIFAAHIGDSRTYVLSGNRLLPVTRDHSYVNQLVDDGRISPKEAFSHPAKNRITKALGISHNCNPEIAAEPLLLKNGDIILQCSDGLSDMVDDKTLELLMTDTRKNPDTAVNRLLTEALNNGGKDNVTIQLVKITESPWTQTVIHGKIEKGGRLPRKSRFLKKAAIYVSLIMAAMAMIALFAYILSIKPEFNLREKFKNRPWKNLIDSIPQMIIPDSLNTDTGKTNPLQSDPQDHQIPTSNHPQKDDIGETKTDDPPVDFVPNTPAPVSPRNNPNEKLAELKGLGVPYCGGFPEIGKCAEYLSLVSPAFKDSVKELAYRSALYQLKNRNTSDKIEDLSTFYLNKFPDYKNGEWTGTVHRRLMATRQKDPADTVVNRQAVISQQVRDSISHHIVKKGDNAYRIMSKYHINDSTMKALNPDLKLDSVGNLILIPGDILKIR